MTTKTWDTIAAEKRAARDTLIPEAWRVSVDDSLLDVTDVPRTSGVLSPAEVEITETEAPELVRKMIDRELTSEAVVTAFCKRAAIAQQLVGYTRPQ
jgi:amidase